MRTFLTLLGWLLVSWGRRLSPRGRTRLAQAVYGTGGFLFAHLRWYSHLYELPHGDDPAAIIRLPRRWMPAGWPVLLYDISEKIDPVHWSHWAYVPQGETVGCTCGGHLEVREDGWAVMPRD